MKISIYTNMKSSTTSEVLVIPVNVIVSSAEIVMTVLVVTCVAAAITSANVSKLVPNNSRITSLAPAPALKSVMVSLPKPAANTNVSLPPSPVSVSLPAPPTKVLPKHHNP